jgi:hypothetical protein
MVNESLDLVGKEFPMNGHASVRTIARSLTDRATSGLPIAPLSRVESLVRLDGCCRFWHMKRKQAVRRVALSEMPYVVRVR